MDTYINVVAQNRLICEALGLNPNDIISIKMEFSHKGPKVVVEYILHDEHGKSLALAISSKRFEWVERVPKSETYDADGNLLYETEERIARS